METPAPAAEETPGADAAHPAACPNCAAPLPAGAAYCPRCGQGQPTHRLSTGHVLHEAVHVFTHADKSFFAFAGQVLSRPGQVVADYLAGRRKRYFSPFQFLLLVVGLVTLLGNKLHYYDNIGHGVLHRRHHDFPAAEAARVAQYFHAVGTFFNVWWLVLLPLHALWVWRLYRRAGLNYAEAVLVEVVLGCAFQLGLLVALPSVLLLTAQQPGVSTALLQGLFTVGYLAVIGRRALGLGWGGALGRALAVGLLTAGVNFGLNYAAFKLYVAGHL